MQPSHNAEETVLIEIANLAHQCALELVTSEMAEDLAQDITLECLAKLRAGCSVEEIQSILPRVGSVVRRRVVDGVRAAVRRKRRNVEYCGDWAATTRAWMSPELACEEHELSQFLSYIVESLSPMQRLVYTIVREEATPYDEAAERLGVSRHAICWHIVGAQNVFRRALERAGIAAPAPGRGGGRVKREGNPDAAGSTFIEPTTHRGL